MNNSVYLSQEHLAEVKTASQNLIDACDVLWPLFPAFAEAERSDHPNYEKLRLWAKYVSLNTASTAIAMIDEIERLREENATLAFANSLLLAKKGACGDKND